MYDTDHKQRKEWRWVMYDTDLKRVEMGTSRYRPRRKVRRWVHHDTEHKQVGQA